MDIKKIVFKNLDGSLRKVNIVNSINGIDIPDSGAVILDTVKDISPDGSSLTVTKSDGSSSKVTLNTSGGVKTVNNIQPDEQGNIALNYVSSAFVASGMMTVTSQNGTQHYDLTTQYSSTEESTDGSQVISVNTKTKYHSITLNTSNTSITFANPTQDEGTSKSPASESSSAVIKLELFIKQGTGTNTITWPTNVKWENGIAPVLSLEKDHVDLISLVSLDNGQNYYGFAKAVWMN